MGRCHSKRAEQNEFRNTYNPERQTNVPMAIRSEPLVSSVIADPQMERRQPRVVFVSLFQLWKTWDDVPSDILLDAIIVINGRRAQLFPVSNDEIIDAREWPFSQLHFTTEFVEFLRFKDGQGLVIFMREREEIAPSVCFDGMSSIASVKTNKSMATQSITSDCKLSLSTIDRVNTERMGVSPLWDTISQHLSSIIDPFAKDFYYRLTLSMEWWQCRDITELHYCNDTQSVCNELQHCNGNYKAMMAIFKLSNPTLIPMIRYERRNFEIEIIGIRSYYVPPQPNTLYMVDPNPNDNHCNTTAHTNTKHNSIECNYFGDVADEDGFVYDCESYESYANDI